MRTSGSFAPDKTNERPGTRAKVRYARMSAWKVRVVLDLIRGKSIGEAAEILQFTERASADVIGKCLASAVANAVNNDGETAEDLYVSACYADEGPTLKRWRPRARGRATRIRKRTSHLTIVVSRLPEEHLERLRARDAARAASRSGRATRSAAEARRRRVERSRGGAAEEGVDTEALDDEDAATLHADVVQTEAAIEAREELEAEEAAEAAEQDEAEVADDGDEVGAADEADAGADVAEDEAGSDEPADEDDRGSGR
jgi:large subunit ribosomal protein L22